MRILIFNQYFWPENFRINDIALSFKKLGHDVEVLTGKPNYPEGKIYKNYTAFSIQKETWGQIPIYRLPIFPRGKGGFLDLLLNYTSFLFSGFLLAPWVLKFRKFDVIFVYGTSPIFQSLPASFYGFLRKTPVLLYVQDLWPESIEATGYIRNIYLLSAIKILVKFTYKSADLILTQSKSFKHQISLLVNNKPIYYCPNSVGNKFYNKNHLKIKLPHVLHSGFNIMFTGNVGHAQSVETILSAAIQLKDYKDIKIIIIGEGSKLEWLRNEILRIKITNVFLLGSFKEDLMPYFMSKASALLVTLSNKPIFSFTVPNKIQAYLTSGKPIIAALNGEGAEVIRLSQSGLVVPAEDPSALSEAIIRLYKMPVKLRHQMGLRGRKYFMCHYDHKFLMEKLVYFCQKTIQRGCT
jgi:glycosyltransferase involved in cell wall biosynthesis